jgi:hypothetical protein
MQKGHILLCKLVFLTQVGLNFLKKVFNTLTLFKAFLLDLIILMNVF